VVESELKRLIEGITTLTAPLAEGDTDPAGGPIAAIVAALAASLVAAVADRSRDQWDEAAGARAQAQALRRRALTLAEGDADAYADARAALAQRGGAGDQQARDARIGEAVSLAAYVPLEIGAIAGDVAQLASEIATHGTGEVRADAAIAAILAAGAARAATKLVEVNLVAGADEQLVAVARRQAEAALAAAGLAAEQD
jgi:formiminotetrahydrofolate cyclodeaminase